MVVFTYVHKIIDTLSSRVGVSFLFPGMWARFSDLLVTKKISNLEQLGWLIQLNVQLQLRA